MTVKNLSKIKTQDYLQRNCLTSFRHVFCFLFFYTKNVSMLDSFLPLCFENFSCLLRLWQFSFDVRLFKKRSIETFEFLKPLTHFINSQSTRQTLYKKLFWRIKIVQNRFFRPNRCSLLIFCLCKCHVLVMCLGQKTVIILS